MNSLKTTSRFNGTGSSRSLLLVSIILGLAALVSVIATIDDLGVTNDEQYYYDSCLQQITWFTQTINDFSSGRWSAPFAPEVIDRYWSYKLFYNVHPAFYKLCSSLTLTIFEPWLGTMGAYRLAPAVMFSVLVALLFWTVGRRYGMVAGFWAAGAFALMPRIFGHAHFGCTDMPLTLLWFASAVSFHRALESRKWAPVFALVYGLALATKFTAFVVVLPLVVFVLVSRRFKQAAWPVGVALVVRPLVMIGINPQWWHSTFERVYSYLINSATRFDYLHIATYYLGRSYAFYLPWHHPLVLTAFTVSPLVLAGFIYGLWRIAGRPFGDLWASHMLLHWLGLIFVMMLPSSPGHDGVRLFLPSFAFLAVISAKGFYHFAYQALPWLLTRLRGLGRRFEVVSVWLLLGAMIVPSAAVLARVHPYELCYYNSLAGGIPGACELGMETTYWWDPINEKACGLINDTLPDSAVVYGRNDYHYRFLQKLGRIKTSLKFRKEDFDYLLEDSRQGTFAEYAWILYRNVTPLVELKKDGVRLFAIFKVPEVFKEILADLDNSEAPEALYEKAVIYEAMREPDSAYLFSKKYLEHRPKDFKANMRIVSICLDKSRADEAIEHLQRVAVAPENPQLWLSNMGTVYYQKGEYERAIACFQQCLKYKRLDQKIFSSIAQIYYRMGRLEESTEQYELVLRTRPYDEMALHMLSIINHKLKNTERAKYYYNRLLDENPRHLASLVNMGLLEVGDGDFKKAGEFFLKALEVDSTYIAANFNIANLFAGTGKPRLAEKHYKIILAKHPDDIQSHTALALLYLQDPARQAEALEHFRTLARLNPEQAEFIEEEYIRPLQEKLARPAGTP